MRDPFRPNSNKQLIREAQIAFIVIALLLCVLVYVALHRISGKKFHFQQIAQTAPLAQHIDDNAYPAQAILDHDSNIAKAQKTPIAISPITRPIPTREGISASKTASAQPSSTKPFFPRPLSRLPKQFSAPKILPPTPEPIKTLPVKQEVVTKSVPVLSTPKIAQAQFVAPVNDFQPEPAFTPQLKTQSVTTKPVVDNPFEKIKSIAPSFKPPAIKSNFGAGSTRELPSFDAPIKIEPTEVAKNPTPTPLHPSMPKLHSGSFVPKQTEPFSIAKVTDKKISQPKQPKQPKPLKEFTPQSFTPKPLSAKLVKPEPFKPTTPRPLGPDEYRVQKTDSLWSIAADNYGDGRFFRALHEHNISRIASADQLQPNTTIVIPQVDDLLRRYPELCPADKFSDKSRSSNINTPIAKYVQYEQRLDQRFHITRSGDTLFDVARERLGQASRYLEIFELNKFRIPQQANHLTPLGPGLRLLLPE